MDCFDLPSRPAATATPSVWAEYVGACLRRPVVMHWCWSLPSPGKEQVCLPGLFGHFDLVTQVAERAGVSLDIPVVRPAGIPVPASDRPASARADRGNLGPELSTAFSSQKPRALAWQLRQPPQHQIPYPTPEFNPGEPAGYPAHQALEGFLPASGVHAVTSGHRKIVSLHTPMISGGRSLPAADPRARSRSMAGGRAGTKCLTCRRDRPGRQGQPR